MKYSCVRLHCVIHKNSLLLNQHNGDDAPQNCMLTNQIRRSATHHERPEKPARPLSGWGSLDRRTKQGGVILIKKPIKGQLVII